MAAVSRLGPSPEHATRERAPSCAATPAGAGRRRAPRPGGRLPRAVTARRSGSGSLATPRWAFAFYGGLTYAPVGMAAATWFTR